MLAFALLLGGAYALYTRAGAEYGPRPSGRRGAGGFGGRFRLRVPADAAPDFTVYDGEGNEVHLSDYAGKPVVLNFWSSRCGPCQTEMPDFHEAYLELGQDLHFLWSM